MQPNGEVRGKRVGRLVTLVGSKRRCLGDNGVKVAVESSCE
jgi:hypothetical protein